MYLPEGLEDTPFTLKIFDPIVGKSKVVGRKVAKKGERKAPF